MAETTTISPPPGESIPSNATTIFTFQEQMTASVGLYAMSLLCIIIGGIRSVHYVKNSIKKKRLIEGSITLKEAKKFPLSASMVLFGLYLVFKPANERYLWVASVAQRLHFPQNYVDKINETVISYTSTSNSSESSQPFYQKSISLFPSGIKENISVPEYVLKLSEWLVSKVETLGKEEFMIFLTFLICFEGLVSLATLLKPFVTCFFKLNPFTPQFLRFNVPYLFSLKKGTKEMDEGDIEVASKKDTEYLFKFEIDRHDILALIICSPVLISHLVKRHWITNNLIGIAFSILGIEKLHLSSFKAGALLLAGLFIYDIFWVFATDVMTSVAKGIDAPILLQFPQDIYRNGPWEASKHSMLGLGDIVIPGVFISLLRRFDQRVVESGIEGKNQNKKERYYFCVTIFAYAIGLILTMAVMHHFKAAQPALLYLVPCCLLIPLALSGLRGETSLLWNYDEGKHVDNEENRKRVDSSKKNN